MPTIATPSKAPKPFGFDPAVVAAVAKSPRDSPVSVTFDAELAAHVTPLLVLAVWADEAAPDADGPDADADAPPFQLPPSLDVFPEPVRAALRAMAAESDFHATAGSSTEVLRLPPGAATRMALYGLGKRSALNAAASVVVGAGQFAVAKGMDISGCEQVSVFVDGAGTAEVAAAAEGALLGGYVDERFRKPDRGPKVPGSCVLAGTAETPALAAAATRGCALAKGIMTTRDLVNAPPNVLTPAAMAAAAEQIASDTGMAIKVLGREQCEALGMGSFLGVGQGSTDEPKFIHMTYTPPGGASTKVAVVGKSVTFDTGGNNIKAGAGSKIELMKNDMGGGGTALGAAVVLGALQPAGVEVHFIMPAVENMVSDTATHPGDIFRASNGKTVEVINTDAEGRLCLADGLVYAEALGDVDYVVDLATLTGSMVLALGEEVAGVWCKSDDFADALLSAAKASGEELWRMPLVAKYKGQLKSKIADLRNLATAGSNAGSVTAALFLAEFVKTDNWAHIDIAGTAWDTKNEMGTGYGVKMLTHWIESLALAA